MDYITSQIETIRWLFSPIGLVTVLALTAFVLSGIPGALLLRAERRVPARQIASPPGADLTSRENMSP